MPEMHFHIRWPDGSREACYSPSLVIKDFFVPGTAYDLADFLAKCRVAFGIASDRVKAKYGHACSGAMEQLARIEERATDFTTHPAAKVLVESFAD